MRPIGSAPGKYRRAASSLMMVTGSLSVRVVFIEIAPLERNAHRLEIAGTDETPVGAKRRCRPFAPVPGIWISLEVFPGAQRNTGRCGGRLHARQRREPVEEPFVERPRGLSPPWYLVDGR